MSFSHLQSQRIKGGGASRGERWEGGSLRKDSKFRKGVGAAGYKKSELLRTDRHSFEPGKRGLGWGSVAHSRAPTCETAFTGNGVRAGGRPKVLLALTAFLQPQEVPPDREEVSPKKKTRNLFSSPICISFLHPSSPAVDVLPTLSPSCSLF